jgi:hypothetical protein
VILWTDANRTDANTVAGLSLKPTYYLKIMANNIFRLTQTVAARTVESPKAPVISEPAVSSQITSQ